MTPLEDCGTILGMPSLAEEDPEYPSKVVEYCSQHGLKELPFGFILAKGHLVAVSTYRERLQAALGPVLVVVESNEPNHPAAVEPVSASHPGEGAAAVGVKAADGGTLGPAVVIPG